MPTRCQQCDTECWSGDHEYDLCTRCMIGGSSPSLWAMKRIKRAMSEQSWANANTRNISQSQTLTYNINTGECVGVRKVGNGPDEDYVTIMIRVYCYPDFSHVKVQISTWVDHGSTWHSNETYQVSSFDVLVEEVVPLIVTEVCNLIAFAKKGQYSCSGCKDNFYNPPAGRHFAGVYCSVCWEAYKKKNARTCGRCRQPLYKCHC